MNEKAAVSLFVAAMILVSYSCQGWAAEETKKEPEKKEKGLILCLKLDEKKGTVANDSSGSGHNAEIRGAKWVEGKFGCALEFDGSDNCVVITNFAGLPAKEITISVWQKVNEVRQQHLFCLSPDDGTDRMTAHTPWEDEQLYWDFGSIGDGGRLNYAPAKPIVGIWQHFVFVASQSGKYMKIYRNGAQEASEDNANPGCSGTARDLFIGSGAEAQILYAGLIGEFRMYDRALTENEIKALHKEKADTYKD